MTRKSKTKAHSKPKAPTLASGRSERWVIKAGSQMVCEGGPLLIRAWMRQVQELKRDHGIDVIWVTSGAIASAAERTGFARSKRTVSEKQALSAMGQPMVMDLYELALNSIGLLGAQVLLTAGDIRDPIRRKNLQNTLHQILKWQAVPVLNENDAVATDEIKFGDNDNLSSQIAVMMKAKRLILLTDVDGLYDRDPKRHVDAELIHFKKSISKQDLRGVTPQAGSSRSTGGMYSKLMAAEVALRAKIQTHLVRGDVPRVLLRLAESDRVGTQIGGRP